MRVGGGQGSGKALPWCDVASCLPANEKQADDRPSVSRSQLCSFFIVPLERMKRALTEYVGFDKKDTAYIQRCSAT